MPNIKLTLQYDGTRYLGWTRPAADGYAETDFISHFFCFTENDR